MFKEIKLPFNLNLLEALSILAFIAIGYSVIYKLGYYLVLDITWFMYELTPMNIVFSSVVFIIVFIISLFFGFVLFKLISKAKNITYRILYSLIGLGLTFIFAATTPNISDLLHINIFGNTPKLRFLNLMVLYIWMGFLLMDSIKDIKGDLKEIIKKDRKTIIAFSILIFLYPFVFGVMEGEAVNKNKDSMLSKVEIKDGGEWFLIHYYNDKFLLLSGGEKNLYKLVEYKDVKSISSKTKSIKQDLEIPNKP